MKDQILLSKNILSVAALSCDKKDQPINESYVSTILSNMAYYGFVPSLEIIQKMNSSSDEQLVNFWKESEETFKSYFKDVLDAKEGIVYKNFPQEVLNMSESEYWFNQVMMYFGVNKGYFVEEEKEREKDDVPVNNLKVLSPEREDSLVKIFNAFKDKKVSILEKEKEWVEFLLNELSVDEVNISDYAFKLNGAYVASVAFKNGKKVSAKNYTDILRFAGFVYDSQLNLNNKISFFKFSRAFRKQVLKMMLAIPFYEEDIAARKETFKALFKALHPGDFAWAKPVSKIYDELYNKKLKSFNAKVEMHKESQNEELFSLLESRPGVFLKKFHEMYSVNKKNTVVHFEKIVSELTIHQLLKFKKYIETINERHFIIARANSTFENAKVLENNKIKIDDEDKSFIINLLSKVLTEKTNNILPAGVSVDSKMDKVYIPSNDQETFIGRGTITEIPEGVNFLRTASYWISHDVHNVWFDNSWNFLHKDHDKDDACCWNNPQVNDGMAIFSGDPTSANSEEGKAAQLIDINIDKLKEEGFEYAVWNLLSYNNTPFAKAEKVFACMQFLNDQNKGELFEPSKVELQFEVKGNNLNKAVFLLDINNRSLICLDMPFPYLNVRSAMSNIQKVRDFMNPLNEYLKTLPTVGDLLEFAKKEDSGIPFVYSDKEKELNGKAFVFKKENENSNIEDVDVFSLLKK